MEEPEWDGEGSFLRFVVSGALAGVAEHTGIYPVDTIKTHMQAKQAAGLTSQTPFQSTVSIYKRHGVRGYFRGVTAVIGGAAPAHALYFTVYEVAKRKFGADGDGHTPVQSAAAGITAAVSSDFLHVPMDTTKQKMQLGRIPYRNVIDCIRTVVRTEGALAFWAGYTTTLAMSLPYGAVYFATYESACKLLTAARRPQRVHDPQLAEQAHTVGDLHYEHGLVTNLQAGCIAGACAAAMTNPLDVVKTRLQTQGDVEHTQSGSGRRLRGLLDALRHVYRTDGPRVFLRGIRARMLLHATSGGIAWSTYEYCKKIIGT